MQADNTESLHDKRSSRMCTISTEARNKHSHTNTLALTFSRPIVGTLECELTSCVDPNVPTSTNCAAQ